MGPVVGGTAAEDAVVVGGEALCLHQRLLAAGRAAVEVGVAGGAAVEGGDDRLRRRGHLMRRPPAEIRPFLRMADQGVAILVARWRGAHFGAGPAGPRAGAC